MVKDEIHELCKGNPAAGANALQEDLDQFFIFWRWHVCYYNQNFVLAPDESKGFRP
jgi:hypothetical protein